MCEYCGCQDILAIAALTSEHDEMRGIGRTAVRAAHAGDWPTARAALATLLTVVEPHTEIEERGLFPPMASEFDEHVSSLRDDHQRLHAAFTELAGADTPPADWATQVDAAVGGLFEHILREQDGLFPASVSVLTADQWDELDAVRMDVSRRVPEPAPRTA